MFVASGVKEEDRDTQAGVDCGKSPIEGLILIILRHETDNETSEDQRHDNQIGPLHYLGRKQLLLVQARNASIIEHMYMVNDLKTRVTRTGHFEPFYSVNWHFWKLFH